VLSTIITSFLFLVVFTLKSAIAISKTNPNPDLFVAKGDYTLHKLPMAAIPANGCIAKLPTAVASISSMKAANIGWRIAQYS
jgi:hypothetical protein